MKGYQLDDADLRRAAAELAAAREMLRESRQSSPPDRAAFATAVARAALASRTIAEVVDRCRGSALAKGAR